MTQPPTGVPHQPGPFFRHRPGPPDRPEQVSLDDATRLMCAGTYLSPGFARSVIRELVEDERRAVVPSVGYDIDPVLRHAFRANRIDVARNGLLTALLVVTGVLMPALALIWVAAGILVGTAALGRATTESAGAPGGPERGRARRGRLVSVVTAIAIVAGLVALYVYVLPMIVQAVMPEPGFGWSGESPFRSLTPNSTGATILMIALIGLVAVALAYVRRRGKAAAIGTAVGGLMVLCYAGTQLAPSWLSFLPGLSDWSSYGRGANCYDPNYGYYTCYYGDSGSWTDISVAKVLVLLILVYGVQVYFRYRIYNILTTDLGNGSTHRLPGLPLGRIGRRVQAAAAAQWGNLGLHGHRNPFLGAGKVTRAWSACLALRSRTDPDRHVHVDPVAMYDAVRAGLHAMRNNPLPDNEKITGLLVTDHIVGSGLRRQDDTLLDGRGRTPFDEASYEAIDAIRRYPQGSLRYYLRATIGADGRTIKAPPDRVVAPPQIEDLAVSTFVYLAMEGGLFYVEVVSTVMPPVKGTFRQFDFVSPNRVLRKAFRDVLGSFLPVAAAAPVHLIHSVTGGGPVRHMDRADRDNREAHLYDYGARAGIRQLAAGSSLGGYLHDLDAEKYTKIMNRSITDSVVGYLRSQGVDTGEVEARITHLHNEGTVIMGGTVTGPVSGKDGVSVSQ